jgi:hypothetical protein
MPFLPSTPSTPALPSIPGGPGGPGINHLGSIYAEGGTSFVSAPEPRSDREPEPRSDREPEPRSDREPDDLELELDELELDELELDEQVDSVSLAQEVLELFNGPSHPQSRERERERERLCPRPRLCSSGYTCTLP